MAWDDPDYPALLVANYLFGGSGLNSRLMLRVRQKDGLTYGVASQLSAGEIDHAGHFGISATAARSSGMPAAQEPVVDPEVGLHVRPRL